MISYLLHSSLLLGVVFLFYWVLLRKETFYKLNRIFLIGSVVLALVLPLISIPAWMSIKDDLFKKETTAEIIADKNTSITNTDNPINQSAVTEGKKNSVVDNSTTSSPIERSETKSKTSLLSNIDYGKLFWWIYLIGVGVFVLTFLIQFVMIILTRNKLEFIQDDDYRIYEMETETSPFSFMSWIFINPTMYEFETYDQILNHEKIHVRQAHYIDKLIAEIIVMIAWFNPFAWLLRREITNNLEFLTDDTMLRKGTERESYQMNLLKVSVPQHALSLTTNYNQSILKTRIIMMNAKKSSARSSWKYLFILPLLGFSVITLNAVNNTNVNTNSTKGDDPSLNTSELQEEQSIPESTTLYDSEQSGTVTKLSTTNPKAQAQSKAQELAQSKAQEKSKAEESKVYSKQYQNNKVKDKDAKVSIKVKEKGPSRFTQKFKSLDQSKVKPGFWQASVESNDVCFHLNNSFSRNGGNWTMNECFYKNEIENFDEVKQGIFKITRDPGTLVLKGEFDDGYGHGKFNFEADENFLDFVTNLGVDDADDPLLFQLFLSNSTKAFITKVTKDTEHLNKQDLIQRAIFINNEKKYEDLKGVFEIAGETVDFDRMVEIAIHGVDKKYAEEILTVSPDGYSVKELMSCKIHGVDKELIEGLEDYGYTNLTLKELTSLKIHGVDMDEMKEIEKLGFGKMSIQDMVNIKIHGVTKRYVEELKDLGYGDLSPEMIKTFAIHSVDKKHIEGIRSLGFDNLSPDDMVQTKIHGLNPSQVKDIRSLGFDNLSYDQLMKFAIHSVSKSYVEGIREQGFEDLSADDFVNAKIHSINGRYIKEIKSLGLDGVNFRTIKKAKIHGVSARYIKDVKSKGYTMPSLEDYIKHKIHH